MMRKFGSIKVCKNIGSMLITNRYVGPGSACNFYDAAHAAIIVAGAYAREVPPGCTAWARSGT